ncbi:hypothetical protein LY76DRAFT_184742 [Colletotrichum caudatum]|nr:hypothetical protein LY76DRAFT_184742 [Colletotrichum caudatum]
MDGTYLPVLLGAWSCLLIILPFFPFFLCCVEMRQAGSTYSNFHSSIGGASFRFHHLFSLSHSSSVCFSRVHNTHIKSLSPLCPPSLSLPLPSHPPASLLLHVLRLPIALTRPEFHQWQSILETGDQEPSQSSDIYHLNPKVD